MATEELVCNTLMSIPSEQEAMNVLSEMDIKEKRSLLRALKDFIERIKNYLKKHGLIETKAFTDDFKAINKLANMVNESIVRERIKNNTTDSYSINEKFITQYDLWDKQNPRIKFEVGTTSKVLQSIGAPNKIITWDSSKIIKIKAKHQEITDSIIKQVPNILENPIIIMESKTKPDRLTMFGEVYAENNTPILAILELNPVTKNDISLDEIKIASAYAKDNAQRLIDTSNIKYIDKNKNRVNTWEKRTRLQLPVGDSNVNSINSISKVSGNVNTKHSLEEMDNKYMSAVESGIRYSVDDINNSFDIPNNKLGDYIYVQRQVYNTLVKEGFFTDELRNSRTVINKGSGMVIEINKSGIQETFNNNNFSANSKKLKLLKLATIREIPQIIENGKIINDNVASYHKENSSLNFAYIESFLTINEDRIKVVVTIRKSPQKNKFWVHHVYIENDTGSTSAGTSKSSKTAYTTSSANHTLTQTENKVKAKSVNSGTNDKNENTTSISKNDIRYSLTEPGEINDVDLIDLFEDSEEAFDYDFTGSNLDFSQDTKEAIQNTNKILADMNRLTKGKKISDEALLKICKKKIKEYSSKQDADILCRDMRIVLNALEQCKDTEDFNTVFFETIGLCKNVIDKSITKVDHFKEEREKINAILKDYGRIRVDSEQVAEIASAFDGWNNYRKKMFGFANLIKSDNPNSYGRALLYTPKGQIKKVGNVQVNSLKIKGSGLNSNSINSISKVSGNVNTKHSLAEMARNKDIRYSLSDEFSDLSTLDDEKIKLYNNRIWAYGLFTDEDILLLNERYNELRTNKRTDNVLGDGSRLVEVNNKMVIIGGTFNDPKVFSVLVINAFNETFATDIKGEIYEETKYFRRNKETLENVLEFNALEDGEIFIKFYRADDFSYRKGQNDTGERATLPSNFQNYGYTSKFNNRNGNSGKAEQGVSDEKLRQDILLFISMIYRYCDMIYS